MMDAMTTTTRAQAPNLLTEKTPGMGARLLTTGFAWLASISVFSAGWAVTLHRSDVAICLMLGAIFAKLSEIRSAQC